MPEESRQLLDNSPPSQGFLTASSGERITAPPALLRFASSSRFHAPASFCLSAPPPLRRFPRPCGLFSVAFHRESSRPRLTFLKFRPTAELSSGHCRLSSAPVSLPALWTAPFPRFCVPLRVSPSACGTCRLRLSLPPRPSSGPRGFALADARWLQTQPGMFTRPLAPCPLRDSCSLKVSPPVQPPPFRASCSPAFSQGCEALLQTGIPLRAHD